MALYTMFFKNALFCLAFLFSNLEHHSVAAVFSTNAVFSGYRKWAPVNSSRSDMYCPEHCYNNPDEDESCCCCEAVTCWQLNATACNVTIGQLSVEYTNIYGSAVLIPSGNHTLYEVVHRNGKLTEFPDNLCDYADSLVTLDLSFNKIKDISSVKCLKQLDTLRLDSNEIKELSNETFSDMEYLRVVSLSRNHIENLYPNTIQNKNGNIMIVDMSYNVIDSVDVTNIVRPGAFCNMSCEGCEFTTQTNELNYALNENNIHGPGNIILKNTSTNSFLNFSALGLNDYTMLGRYFHGRFEYDESVIECDCKIYPFLAGLGKDASKYWPRLEFNNVTCRNPENMKGRDLNDMYQTQSFEDLTCDIPNCPKGCTCIDKPSDDEIKVVCKGLTSMPDFTPIGYWNNDNINLDCSDPSNEISDLPNKEYMGRLVRLNLDGNSIRKLDDSAVENLSEDVNINMSGQELKLLPTDFRKINPNRIIFGSHPVDCNCDNVWIGDWIRNNKAYGKLNCSTSRGLIPAESFSSEYLDCLTTSRVPDYVPILLGIILVVLISLAAISYYFRYEIMLLKRKYFKNLKETEANDFEFDIMLTYCTENPDVFRWAERKIIPALRQEGYSTFVPFYDVVYGWNRENELAVGISKSIVYIVILCKKYLCNENSVQEFEIVWKHFTMDTNKNIVIINYDNFEAREIRNRRLKAFVRIRDDINFMQRETKLYDRLRKRLHPPMKKPAYDFHCNGNGGLKEEINGSDDDDIYIENKADNYSVEENDKVNGSVSDDSDENKHENGEVVSENVMTKENIRIGRRKRKRGKARRKIWYNRLSVEHTTCNCKYRKCYLGPESIG